MYYIATDKKFLLFEWGRAQLATLKNCAKKNNIVLNEFDYNAPPKDGVLFALGVDALWLEEIAQSVFITTDAVKYHIKKIYRTFAVHSHSELAQLLKDNLTDIERL